MLFLLLQYLSEFKGGIVHNSKLKKISIALCMALLPISVFAAGLGKLNVMSGLGEPLKADIELISVTPEELNSISASIASQEAYATQGIEKPASHNGIKVSIAKNGAGAPILKLNSAEPISEPFLDMLIQVDWSSGRLLREYTVLLDPPGYTGEADSSAQTAQAPIISTRGQKKAERNMATGNASQNDQMTADSAARMPSGTKKSNKRKKAMPVENTGDTEASATEAASGADYTTQRGDSLAKIAREMKPEGVSLEQMLVGLYEANPKAFEGKNMNRLKVGQIIRQPSQETLSAISSGAAKKEIRVQTANWNAYRNKLAGMVAESPSADTEANTNSAGGKIKSAAEDKSTPAATGPKDVVKLSTGDAATSKADPANVKALQDKIASLQEEATAREKSVKEAQDRSASLEKQIADMQKLLAMKNGAMSDLQKQAEAAAAKKPDVATPAPVEPAKPAEVTKPTEVAKPAETAKPETPKPEAETPAVKPVPAAAAPVEEPGFLSSMMDGLDLGLLAPLGGALALLGGGWLYLRKKREKSLADFEQGIMTSGGLKANTVFGNTANSSVDSGDTSFLTDFSQSANGGMIDTNDVDPIAEAEVYMAYGRDAQAEEILKDAIAKEPKRHELHLKLLEMYAASKNLSAFETVAGELYTSLGAEDPTWAKVAEIGIKLEPNNPLYQVNSQPTGSLDATDFADSPLAAEKDLDFSFDNDALTQGFAPTGIGSGWSSSYCWRRY
jgi:pilus assembly protein FimV